MSATGRHPRAQQITRAQLDALAAGQIAGAYLGLIPQPGDTAAWEERQRRYDAALERARQTILDDDGWLGGPYELVDGGAR